VFEEVKDYRFEYSRSRKKMTNIDVGAIERIMQNEVVCDNYKPVVQVINVRRLGNPNDSTTPRYRLVLSDSRHFTQSMAASQLNEMLSNHLQVGELIRLERYIVNNVQNKKIIIVLCIQRLGGPIERVGQPESYGGETVPAQQQQQALPVQQQSFQTTFQQAPPMQQLPLQNNVQQQQQLPFQNNVQQQHSSYHQQQQLPFQSHTIMHQQESGYKQNQTNLQQQQQPLHNQPQSTFPQYQQQQQQNRTPFTGMNANLPMARPLPQKAGTDLDATGFQSIANLNPYIPRLTIKARVMNKGEMKTWNKPSSEGKLFGLDLADASGEIRGVCFKELADRLYPIIQEGQTYVISDPSARLKKANRQFTSIPHEFEITFGNATFEACGYDDDSIPPIMGNWRTLAQVSTENLIPGSTIDIIAVIKSALPVTFIISKKTGKESAKREVTLIDDSGYDIRMTFWGDYAQKSDEFWRACPVVAARGCRISDFGGLSLSSQWSGVYKFNFFNFQRCKQLYDWFHEQGGKDTSTNPLTVSSFASGTSLGPVPMSQRGALDDIQSKDLGADPDKPDYIIFKGTLSFIKTENFQYPACANDGCSKKVVQSTDSSWFCEKCQTTIPDCDRRYMLTTTFLDDTAQAWVSAFNDQALVIFGNITAAQLFQYKEEVEQHDGIFDDFIKGFTNNQFLIKARVKNETWNEVTRVKVSMVDITPLDFIAESAMILSEIANLKASLSS